MQIKQDEGRGEIDEASKSGAMYQAPYKMNTNQMKQKDEDDSQNNNKMILQYNHMNVTMHEMQIWT